MWPVQVCARSSKFSLFDPAKEMAYIQMSRKEKSKGKAAVDLIGSQVSMPAPVVMLKHQYTVQREVYLVLSSAL